VSEKTLLFDIPYCVVDGICMKGADTRNALASLHLEKSQLEKNAAINGKTINFPKGYAK
jgi:hypothetical protein